MGVLLLWFQLASSSSMILYGLGVGTANNNIGMVSPPLSRKFLALYGKGGGERGTLYQILILVPTSMNDAKDVANNPSSSDDKDPLVKSVSDHKKKCICIQCGLPETAQTDSVPKWHHDIFAPNLPKKDKYDIVCEDAPVKKDAAGPYYEEDVQLHSELSKCVVDSRDWIGEGEQSTRPTLENTAKGISPFATSSTMLDITGGGAKNKWQS